ncbi:hypothetical protein LSTR_LSTR016293, partial [Laodelphax striatellus]
KDYSGSTRNVLQLVRGENIIELNRVRNRSRRQTTLSIARAMSLLVQGQLTLIEFLRRASHQTERLFDVSEPPVKNDEGLLRRKLEENNAVPPSPEWFGLEVAAEVIIPLEEAEGPPARVPQVHS